MSKRLLQPPEKCVKVLRRTDHFYVDTSVLSAARQPRVYASDSATAALGYTDRQGEEAGICMNVRVDSPHYDVTTTNAVDGSGNTKSLVFVNPPRTGAGAAARATAIAYTSSEAIPYTIQSSSTGTNQNVIWFSNFDLCNAAGSASWAGYLTHWVPNSASTSALGFNTEMCEPYGLSQYMTYYNKVTVYSKRIWVRFEPLDCHASAAISSTTGAPVTGTASAAGNQLLYDTNITSDTPYIQSYLQGQNFVITANDAADVQYKIWNNPFENFERRLSLAQREERMKIKAIRKHRLDVYHGQKVALSYGSSFKSIFGINMNPELNYWRINAGSWVKPTVAETGGAAATITDNVPHYVCFRIQTFSNSQGAGFIPVLRGRVTMKTFTKVLFWDRKDVVVVPVPKLITEEDLTFEDDPAEVELEDLD